MKSKMGGAFFVALGIFLSRILGLVRERVFAHYFGNSVAGDAFKAALKIPNFLQNLLGEGVLSASFIPVYSRLLAQKLEVEARDVALVVLSFLSLLVTILVLIGVASASYFIDLVAPGFEGEQRLLTIKIVQILFPGVGLLVISAWCLGVLNSHRLFFLSYVAPVFWNISIIAFLVFFGGREQSELALWTALGLVIGSLAQLLVQVPLTLKSLGRFYFKFDYKNLNFKRVLTSFSPVVVGRGVVQISSYIDNVIASYFVVGSISSLAYAQTLYLLPVSLFGMSISAAELPEMSRQNISDNFQKALSERIQKAQKRMMFFIIPSCFTFIFLAQPVVTLIYKTGEFGFNEVKIVSEVLACFSLGLIFVTRSRLLASCFYSMLDTKTPFWISVVKIIFGTALALYLCFELFPKWGALNLQVLGLAIAAAVASVVEFSLLIIFLKAKGVDPRLTLKGWVRPSLAASLAVYVALFVSGTMKAWIIEDYIKSLIILASMGISYLLLCLFFRVEEAKLLTTKLIK